MYVQYGCGFTAPEEWVNFDASVTLRWERLPFVGGLYTKNPRRFPSNVRFGDIVAGLPVPAASCRGVYASHVLEHLSLEDFHKAIENTKRILQDGGIFRLIVPDLECAAREYLKRIDAGDPKANLVFLGSTSLGCEKRDRSLRKLVHSWLKTSAHLWMWDGPSLIHALEEHCFHDVRLCTYGDCKDAMFAFVEEPARFEHAVAVEARR